MLTTYLISCVAEFNNIYTLLVLKAVEMLIMAAAIGVAYYHMKRKDRNIHFTNGRAVAAMLIALAWAHWTANNFNNDYTYLSINGNGLLPERLFVYIINEIENILITIATANHLLGGEFRILTREYWKNKINGG